VFDLDETENILYQMMLHTQEDFRAKQLQVSRKAPEYFDTDCKHPPLCGIFDAHLSISSGQLKKNPTMMIWPIKSRIDELKIVSNEEAAAAASLIERCLHLLPEQRSTAAELLSDRWFDGVE
jgi:serine/threonine protein kinase